MSRVGPLIMFGIAIFVCGLYWALWDGARSYLDFIIVNDVYYELIAWLFQMIPAVLLFVGIICIIVGSIGAVRMEVEQY